MQQIAVKKLTASDLSFFAHHLKLSKQKGVNLNSDILVEEFYPALRNQLNSIVLPLRILGPGGADPHVLSRKIVRTPGAKNWRLNGEIVNDPADEANRYLPLVAGDLAIFSFDGGVTPDGIDMVVVSAIGDAPLHRMIVGEVDLDGRQSMKKVVVADIDRWRDLTVAHYRGTHPLSTLIVPSTVEDALFGSADEQDETAKKDGRGAAISKEGVKRQLQASEDTGQRGEEAFNRLLLGIGQPEGSYEWVSQTHARAAFDFLINGPKWKPELGAVHLDVKSTRGERGAAMHMSMAEVRFAARTPNYRIGRVYGLDSGDANALILSGVHERCAEIIRALGDALPTGVSVDSFEIALEGLSVEDEIRVPKEA